MLSRNIYSYILLKLIKLIMIRINRKNLILLFILILALTGFRLGNPVNADAVEDTHDILAQTNSTGDIHTNLANLTVNEHTSPLPEAVICSKDTPQPVDPVEMNSVNLHYQLSSIIVIETKTIHDEKQTFACSRINDPV